MKSKIKSLLILSGLSTLFLTACNSGTSTPQAQTTPPTESAPPTEGEDVISSVLQFVGTKVANDAVSNYMKANGITVGDLALNTQNYPLLNSIYQALGNSTNEILAGLTNLSNQLQQDTLLLQVQEQQDYQKLMAMQLSVANQQNQQEVDTLMTNVNDSYTIVTSWLNEIDKNESNDLPTMASIFQGLVAESTFSSNQANIMIKKIKTFPFASTNTEANNNLEDGGFALGMDVVDAVYNWTQPISSSTQTQYVTNSFFNQQLLLQEKAYINANPFGQPNDSFQLYKHWSDSLDVMYAQILDTLLQIGAVDQVRVYLYANIPSNSSTIPSIPAYIPSSHYSSLADMESDVAYAMQYRIQNLTMAIQQSKDRMFNYYFGTITSTTMASQCNLTESAFLTVTESQVYNSLGYWDNSSLKTYCKTASGSTVGNIYQVNTLCTLNQNHTLSTIGQSMTPSGQAYSYPNMNYNSNNYNLYVWNGNISCGINNWNQTTFNGIAPNYSINTLQPVGDTGAIDIDAILTWGNNLQATGSPVPGLPVATTSFSGGSAVINNWLTLLGLSDRPYTNQSLHFQGTFPNVKSTAGTLIFDGAHAYTTVIYSNPNASTNIGIQCLSGDSSCSFGAIGNGSYYLNFTNGDTIYIGNYGTLPYNNWISWFQILPEYSVMPANYLP